MRKPPIARRPPQVPARLASGQPIRSTEPPMLADLRPVLGLKVAAQPEKPAVARSARSRPRHAVYERQVVPSQNLQLKRNYLQIN